MASTNTTSPAIDQKSSEPQLLQTKPELWLILIGLTILYAIAVWIDMRRFVWFDELFTLGIARASSLSQLWHMSLKFDSNPMPVYLLSRLSMAVFGPSPLGLRLPSILEFFAGSLAIFSYMRRKVGDRYAAVAVLMLWASGSFFYAIEARPYALVFMCFSFLLLSWEGATRDDTTRKGARTAPLWGVGISNLGLLSAHVFAPLSLFPFLAAECVRFYRTRKPDYSLWAALLLPAVVMVTYLPLIENYQKSLIFSYDVQASLEKVGAFYYSAFDTVVHDSFWLACAAAAAATLLSRNLRGKLFSSRGLPEKVLFALLILNPLFLNLVLMRRHGSFFDRYCITSEAGIYMALVFLLASRLGRSRWMAALASFAMVVMIVHHADSVIRRPDPPNVASIAEIRPDLPLVDGSGATFFEMNYHESAGLLKRVYYLRDREAALHYDHTTYFEDYEAMDEMKPFFHLSGTVEPYQRFVREHHEFLVFGSDQWILQKLRDDGAKLTAITPAGLQSPYLGSTKLYIIEMPPNR